MNTEEVAVLARIDIARKSFGSASPVAKQVECFCVGV